MWLSNSSVGRKVVMSVTGIALVLFLTFHMAMNLVAIISADGYNMVCEFLGANWYALAATVGLAALFVIHIIYAFWLTMQNRKARGSERYAVVDKPKTVEWASQNMLVLGLIVIVGLGLHLFNFWAKMQLPELMHNMGMHADTLTLAYAANGAYHIQQTSLARFTWFFTSFGCLLCGSTLLTVSGALCNHWGGTTKYGSTVGNVFLTSIQRL